MKPTPLTDEQILQTISPELWLHIEGSWKVQALAESHAIETARDAQWEQMLTGQDAVAWSWVYTRLDGHKEKRILWVSDYKDAKGDLEMVLRGAEEPFPVYASPQPVQPKAEPSNQSPEKFDELNQQLLEVCKRMMHYMECTEAVFSQGRMYLDMTLMPSLVKQARAAIAAAEGETK